jgi:hypothetical protein
MSWTIHRMGRWALIACLAWSGCQAGENPPAGLSSKQSQAEPPVARQTGEQPAELSGENRQPFVPRQRSAGTPPSAVFVDVARGRGLIYEWPQQPRPMTALDAFGAGCAVFDADDDGWQDVLLVGTPHPELFRNVVGQRFENVTADSGLAAISGKWTGCAVADYDGDGRLDLLLTGYHQLALYRNAGPWKFVPITEAAGLPPTNNGLWGASAGFMDLDGDQWLDLVLLDYVVYGPDSKKYCEYAPGIISGCAPRVYPPERGQIFRNSGTGRFELVAHEHGMSSTHGVGLVLAFTDLDADGRLDFYIGNDGVPADLLHNDGKMHFTNTAQVAGVATSEDGSAVSAMGADWADYNRDGVLDLAVTNWHGTSFVLFRGLGNGLFEDCSNGTKLARGTKDFMGFGSKWFDIENDGWPDLFFVNGHVYDNSAEIHGPSVPFRQRSGLFWNDHGKEFADLVPNLGDDVKRPLVGRGSATGDFNNDGRVDLLAVDFEGPVMLLENRTETKNHWLKFDLRGKSPNTFGYGARLTGKTGDRVWIAEVSPVSSYLSSSDPRIHWGLGELTQLDELTIRWPSGTRQVLRNVAADQVLRVTEATSSNLP